MEIKYVAGIIGLVVILIGLAAIGRVRNPEPDSDESPSKLITRGIALILLGLLIIAGGWFSWLQSIFDWPAASPVRTQVVGAVGSAETAEAYLSPLKWNLYTADAYGFEVLLPGTPKIESGDHAGWIQHAFQLRGGKLIDSHIAADGTVTFTKRPRDKRLDVFDRVDFFELTTPGDISFSLSRQHFAEPVASPAAELAQLAVEYQTTRGGRTISHREINLHGAPGREIVDEIAFSGRCDFCTTRMFIHEQALYWVSVGGPCVCRDAPTLNRFLDSFRLIPPTKPLPPLELDVNPASGGKQLTQRPDGALQITHDPSQGIYKGKPPADLKDWVLTRSEVDGFEIRFPYTPRTNVAAEQGGARYNMSCYGDRLVMVVEVERKWDESSAVEQTLRQIDRDVRSGRTVVNKIERGEDPALEADVDLTLAGRTLRRRLRVYDYGTIAYRVEAWTEGDTDRNDDAGRFFATFRVLKKP